MMVLRKKKDFCQRCGTLLNLFKDRQTIFEEEHVCNPKDILIKKIKDKEYEEKIFHLTNQQKKLFGKIISKETVEEKFPDDLIVRWRRAR